MQEKEMGKAIYSWDYIIGYEDVKEMAKVIARKD